MLIGFVSLSVQLVRKSKISAVNFAEYEDSSKIVKG